MNEPAIAATMLTPSAVPRWLAGNASVRIAVELAKSIAPPTPLDQPPADDPERAAGAVQRFDGQQHRADEEDQEAQVVDLDPPVHVAEPAERDHQHGAHEQEAHDHPEQVAHVARRQRVEVDAAEDRRQADQHDRAVDGGDQHAHRGVRQGDPLVRRVVLVPARAGGGHRGEAHGRIPGRGIAARHARR